MASPVRAAPKFSLPIIKSQVPAVLKAVENDRTQSVTVSGPAVRIQGDGSNNGIIASTLRLTVDGKQLTIPISKGQTPAQTQRLIEAALPKGYTAQNIPTFAPIDGVWFTIQKNSTTVDMDAAISAAQAKGSYAGEKLSVVELNKMVKGLQVDGFSSDEKEALARAWQGLFNGAEWNATKAAQKKYAELQQKYDLSVFPVR